MNATLYALTESSNDIAGPWKRFRGAYIQHMALEYVIWTCLRPILRHKGLVTSIDSPYTVKFDPSVLYTGLHNYRAHHIDLDYLCSININEMEKGKNQLRNFISNSFLARRDWAVNSDIDVKVLRENSTLKYTITITGKVAPVGMELCPKECDDYKTDGLALEDPSWIKIEINDDEKPDCVPTMACLTVYDPQEESQVKANEPVKEGSHRCFPLFVYKGSIPRVEDAQNDAKIFIREVYLSEAEKNSGIVFGACLNYSSALILQEVLAYHNLVTDVFYELLRSRNSKSGNGSAPINSDALYEKLEEVLGQGGDHEVREFFKEVLLPSIGMLPDNGDGVIDAILPECAISSAEECIGVREDLMKHPPDPEKVIRSAGLAIVRRRFLELSGDPQSIQNVGRTLGHIMSSLIRSKLNISGLIDGLDEDLSRMIEQVHFPEPTADQERYAPEAIKIVTDILNLQGYSENGSGLVAMHALREHKTHGLYLKTMRSLKYSDKERVSKIQGEILDYSKVDWFERDTPYQAIFLAIVMDKDPINPASYDDIYGVCRKLKGVALPEGQIQGAVYTKLLNDVQMTSQVRITAEMSQYAKVYNEELRSAQYKGWLTSSIDQLVRGRI